MQTERSTTLFDFAPVEDRKVVASFDGGAMTSNAGALLLGSADGAVRLRVQTAEGELQVEIVEANSERPGLDCAAE